MRIRPARHYQDRRDPVMQIAAAARPPLARDMRDALRLLGRDIDITRATYLSLSGRWREIARDAIDWAHFREVLKAPFGRMAQTYETAANVGVVRINRAFSRHGRPVRFGTRKGHRSQGEIGGQYSETNMDLPEGGAARGAGGDEPASSEQAISRIAAAVNRGNQILKAVGDRFNFDRLDGRTLAQLRGEQDRLIRDLEVQARDTIELVVQLGMREGLGPAALVQDIRGFISLTERQAQAVLNYRRMLREGDPAALQRVLRNPEHDAMVQAAQREGRDLDEAAINQLTSDYQERYLTHRAQAIAETESNRSANQGLRSAYRQAADRGAIPEEAVKRYWQVDLKENTCPVCLSIPDMNPDGVGLGEPFNSSDGPQDDPPVHPHCGCSVEYITDLTMLPDDNEE